MLSKEEDFSTLGEKYSLFLDGFQVNKNKVVNSDIRGKDLLLLRF